MEKLGSCTGTSSVDSVPSWFRGALNANDVVNDSLEMNTDSQLRACMHGEHQMFRACLGAWQQQISKEFQTFSVAIETSVTAQTSALLKSVERIEGLLHRKEATTQQIQAPQPHGRAEQSAAHPVSGNSLTLLEEHQPRHTEQPIGNSVTGNTLTLLEQVVGQLYMHHEERLFTMQEQHIEKLAEQFEANQHAALQKLTDQHAAFCEDLFRQRTQPSGGKDRETSRHRMTQMSTARSSDRTSYGSSAVMSPQLLGRSVTRSVTAKPTATLGRSLTAKSITKMATARRKHPFVGKWHDQTGSFLNGQVVDIAASGWRWESQRLESQRWESQREGGEAAWQPLAVLSKRHVQLQGTGPDGRAVRYDVAPGVGESLAVRAGDAEYVLKPYNPQGFHTRYKSRVVLSEELQETWWGTEGSDFYSVCRQALADFFQDRIRPYFPSVTREGRPHRLQWIIRTQTYEILRVVLILLDAIFLFWSVERAARKAKNEPLETKHGIRDDMASIVISNLLCAWFVADFLLRVILDGRSVLRRFASWLAFDLFIVVAYVMEIITQYVYLHQRSYSSLRAIVSNLAMLRVLRLLQVANMSQVVRHHTYFRELRLMLYALQGMMKSLLWSLVMVCVILLIFGVVFTEGSLSYCVFHQALSEDYTQQLRDSFGTLSGSMFSLFQVMSNGADWADVYVSLTPLPWWYSMLFIFFQAFTFLALMNVVTAVFVESTMQRSLLDRESLVVDEMSTRKEFLDKLGRLFNEFDADGSGTVSFDRMKEHFMEPAVRAYFTTLGVDANHVGRLFDLLDRDHSGTVDKEEFMFGCQHLRGEAKSLDIAIIRSDLQLMLEGMMDMNQTLDSCILSIRHSLDAKQPRAKTVQ